MATIRPAVAADVDAIARYLAGALRGGDPARYRRFLELRWPAPRPEVGHVIDDGGQLRGFLGTIWAVRDVAGAPHPTCNLTSIAVDESHRKQSLALFAAALRDRAATYTCFTASEQVAKILEFFKFAHRPGAKVIVSPITDLPALRHAVGRDRVHALTGARLDRELDAEQRRLVADHRAYGCGVVLLTRGDRRCLVVTIRRGRDLRAFADVLHASDPGLLAECLPWLAAPLFAAHRTVLTGLDPRWLPTRPRPSFVYAKLRPVHARSTQIPFDQIDGLYSELVPMYGRL